MPTLAYAPIVLVEDITVLTKEQWLNWRKKGIGGSDVAAILNISPFKTKRDLYYEKSGIEPVISDEDNNWVAKEVGHLLEDLVARIYQKKTGYKVYPIRKLFQHPDYPYMLANIDYFVEKPDGTRGILECKTSHYNMKFKWADDSVPNYYECQGRHYLAVANVDFVAFACLFSNSEDDFVMREFERDPDIEESIIFEESYFWNNHVLAGDPPAYSEAGDLALESMRRYFGPAVESAPAVVLDADHASILDRYEEVKQDKLELDRKSRVLEKELKTLSVPIVEQLGTSRSGEFEKDGVRYICTYIPKGRPKINSEELDRLRKEHPDIYAEYVSISDKRTFSLKKQTLAV